MQENVAKQLLSHNILRYCGQPSCAQENVAKRRSEIPYLAELDSLPAPLSASVYKSLSQKVQKAARDPRKSFEEYYLLPTYPCPQEVRVGSWKDGGKVSVYLRLLLVMAQASRTRFSMLASV